MEEIRKDIEGYEGLYQVSNTGKIKSLARIHKLTNPDREYLTKDRLMSTALTDKGYISVQLTQDKKIKRNFVHRLVAIAFHANPENLPQVNHRDKDKTNNNDWNLEWSNNRDNCTHRYQDKSKTVPYTGVTIDNREHMQHKKYKAQIRIGGKQIYLGSHETAELARDAFLDYAKSNNLLSKYAEV